MSGSGTDQDSFETLSTYDVLKHEFEEIWGDFPTPSSLQSYYAAALEKKQAALCLSGGGIRSAAFGLGVVEALAQKGLLSQFHYLSTVSGGGYIGGFLTRWIKERNGDVRFVEDELAKAATTGQPEPKPVQWLREYSNYLTPRTGLASADTWSAGVLWIRNTLINWFVFLPFFLIAAGVPNLYRDLLLAVRGPAAQWLLLLCFLLIAVATYSTCCSLPSHKEPKKRLDGDQVFWKVAMPSLAASFFLPAAFAPLALYEHSFTVPLLSGAPLAGGVTMTLGLIVGYLAAWAATRHPAFGKNFGIWTVGALVSGAAIGLGVYLAAASSCAAPCGWRNGLYAALAPLWVVISQLLLVIYYTAFRKIRRDFLLSPDLDREWLGRLSAVKLRFAVVTAIFSGLVLIGPLLSFKYYPVIGPWLLGLLGSSTGLTAVLGGKSELTGDTTTVGWQKALTFNRIVILAALAFIAVLATLLSWAEASLAEPVASAFHNTSPWALVLAHVVIMVIAGLVLWVTSRRINVNRFSLNSVYRNRIGRAFLGAARDRDPDPFVNFDPKDNVRLSMLRYASGPTDGEPRRVLFPVVNMALNLVGGDRLAWQERKAHSFIATPLACGSPALRPHGIGEALGAYIKSKCYAGREPDVDMPGRGISLATAVSVSGAAASPNMGYNSSPATAFLMTLFNVRLGSWLPNPGYPHSPEDMGRSAPANALLPFLSELGGRTNDKSRNVYLSDGGHFENLALYEMIRRRCRFIVVSDAGHDPDCKFEDLGNAIRKIMDDLDGVAITFSKLELKSRKEQTSSPVTYALGDIDYGGGEIGHLLYIKPSYFASRPVNWRDDLSADIRAYANLHEDFPHESTGDQWFSELQFESYRRLGETIVSALGKGHSYQAAGIHQFFKDL